MKFANTLQMSAMVAPAVIAQNGKQAAPWFRASNMLRANWENSTSECPDGEVLCGAKPEWDEPGYCTPACCDWKMEVTCYDEAYMPTSCALLSEGGCPCPEGEVKCSAKPKWGYPEHKRGYPEHEWDYPEHCTKLCCEEKTCYDDIGMPEICVTHNEECPCPEGEKRCGGGGGFGWPGECTAVCCERHEMTCHDHITGEANGCASWKDGCPCPEGEVKCGGNPGRGYPGECTTACCDEMTEVTCYDYETGKKSCEAIADGGCPCPDGKEKCGENLEKGYTGHCTSVCCDEMTEETCWDSETGMESCEAMIDGGCPCPEGMVKCGAQNATTIRGITIPARPGYCTYEDYCDTAHSGGVQMDPIVMLIHAKGTPEEISYFRNLEMQQKKLLAGDKSPARKMLAIVEHEETELVLAIKHRERDAKGPEGMQANAFAAFVQAKGTPMDIHHFHSLEKELLVHDETPANSANMLAIEREQIKLVRAIKSREEKQLKQVVTKNELLRKFKHVGMQLATRH